jgi:hypothetical protein
MAGKIHKKRLFFNFMVDQNHMPVPLTGHDNILVQEWRDAQDEKRDGQIDVSPSPGTTACYAPATLSPYRFATPSRARHQPRSTPANGVTAIRMHPHLTFAGLDRPARPQR